MIIITNIIIEESHYKVSRFQAMACFAILASVVLTPLGIYLTTLIITEFIIVVAGIMNLLAIIPSYYIVYRTKEKES